MEEMNELVPMENESYEVEVNETPEPSTGEKIVKGVGGVAIIAGGIIIGKKIIGAIGKKFGFKSKDEREAEKLRKKGYVVLTPEQLKEACDEGDSSTEDPEVE